MKIKDKKRSYDEELKLGVMKRSYEEPNVSAHYNSPL